MRMSSSAHPGRHWHDVHSITLLHRNSALLLVESVPDTECVTHGESSVFLISSLSRIASASVMQRQLTSPALLDAVPCGLGIDMVFASLDSGKSMDAGLGCWCVSSGKANERLGSPNKSEDMSLRALSTCGYKSFSSISISNLLFATQDKLTR
jgi:hypothetical protein